MVDLDTPSRDALEQFYFAYRAFTAVPDQLLAERGLSRMHHRVLYFVNRNPGITVGALLQTLRISKQALAAPLKRLQQDNLLQQQVSDTDRRVRQLSLTAPGRALEHRLSQHQAAHLQRAFAETGEAAREGWFAVLKALQH